MRKIAFRFGFNFRLSNSDFDLMLYLWFKNEQNVGMMRDYSQYQTHTATCATCLAQSPMDGFNDLYNQLQVNQVKNQYVKFDENTYFQIDNKYPMSATTQITVELWVLRELPTTPPTGDTFRIWQVHNSIGSGMLQINMIKTSSGFDVNANSGTVVNSSLSLSNAEHQINQWSHLSISWIMTGYKRLQFSFDDRVTTYATSNRWPLGLQISSFRLGQTGNAAGWVYYFFDMRVWSQFRTFPHIRQTRFRDFSTMQHPYLISNWRFVKEDLPDGLTLHDYASQAVLPSVASYGGKEFDKGKQCPYDAQTCASDPVDKTFVFQNGNYRNYELKVVGGQSISNYFTQAWLYYDIDACPAGSNEDLYRIKQGSKQVSLMAQKPTATLDSVQTRVSNVYAGSQSRYLNKQWFNLNVQQSGGGAVDVSVKVNNAIIHQCTNCMNSISNTLTIRFATIYTCNIIYMFREVSIFQNNKFNTVTTNYINAKAFKPFIIRNIPLSSEMTHEILIFYSPNLGPTSIQASRRYFGDKFELDNGQFNTGGAPTVSNQLKPLVICQLGQRYMPQGYCGKADQGLYLSRPDPPPNQNIQLYQCDTVLFEYYIQMWFKGSFTPATSLIGILNSSPSLDLKYKDSNTRMEVSSGTQTLTLSESINEIWVGFAYWKINLQNTKFFTNIYKGLGFMIQQEKSMTQVIINVGQSFKLGDSGAPNKISIRSFNVIKGKIEENLAKRLIQETNGFNQKEQWDVSFDYSIGNKLWVESWNVYLPTNTGWVIEYDTMLATKDCGDFTYSQAELYCRNEYYDDAFKADHAYKYDISGFSGSISASLMHSFWINYDNSVTSVQTVFNHKNAPQTGFSTDQVTISYTTQTVVSYSAKNNVNQQNVLCTYSISSTLSPCLNNWCFMGFIRRNFIEQQIYIGNRAAETCTLAVDYNGATLSSDLHIGGRDGTGQYFNGKLDHFKITSLGSFSTDEVGSIMMTSRDIDSFFHVNIYYIFNKVNLGVNNNDVLGPFANIALPYTITGTSTYFQTQLPVTQLSQRWIDVNYMPQFVPQQKYQYVALAASVTLKNTLGTTSTWMVDFEFGPNDVVGTKAAIKVDPLFSVYYNSNNIEIRNAAGTIVHHTISQTIFANNVYHLVVTKTHVYLEGNKNVLTLPFQDLINNVNIVVTFYDKCQFREFRIYSDVPDVQQVIPYFKHTRTNIFNPFKHIGNLIVYIQFHYEPSLCQDQSVCIFPIWYENKFSKTITMQVTSGTNLSGKRRCGNYLTYNGVDCQNNMNSLVVGGNYAQNVKVSTPVANHNDPTWAFEVWVHFYWSTVTVMDMIAMYDGADNLQGTLKHNYNIGAPNDAVFGFDSNNFNPVQITQADQNSWHHFIFQFNGVGYKIRGYKNNVQLTPDLSAPIITLPKSFAFAPTISQNREILIKNLKVWDDSVIFATMDHREDKGWEFLNAKMVRYFTFTDEGGLNIKEHVYGGTYGVKSLDVSLNPNYPLLINHYEIKYNLSPFIQCPGYSSFSTISKQCEYLEKIMPTVVNKAGEATHQQFTLSPTATSYLANEKEFAFSMWFNAKLNLYVGGPTYSLIEQQGTNSINPSKYLNFKVLITGTNEIQFKWYTVANTLYKSIDTPARLITLQTWHYISFGVRDNANSVDNFAILDLSQVNSAFQPEHYYRACYQCSFHILKKTQASESGTVAIRSMSINAHLAGGDTYWRLIRQQPYYLPEGNFFIDTKMYGRYLQDGLSNQFTYFHEASYSFYELQNGLSSNDPFIAKCPLGLTIGSNLKCDYPISNVQYQATHRVDANVIGYIKDAIVDKEKQFAIQFTASVATGVSKRLRINIGQQVNIYYINPLTIAVYDENDVQNLITNNAPQLMFNDNTFYTVTIIFDQKKVKLYIGSTLANTTTLTAPIRLKTSQFTMGIAHVDQDFKLKQFNLYYPPPPLSTLLSPTQSKLNPYQPGLKFITTPYGYNGIYSAQEMFTLPTVSYTPEGFYKTFECPKYTYMNNGNECREIGSLQIESGRVTMGIQSSVVDNQLMVGGWINAVWMTPFQVETEMNFRIFGSQFRGSATANKIDMKYFYYSLGVNAQTQFINFVQHNLYQWYYVNFYVVPKNEDAFVLDYYVYENSILYSQAQVTKSTRQSLSGIGNLMFRVGPSQCCSVFRIRNWFALVVQGTPALVKKFMYSDVDANDYPTKLLFFYRFDEMGQDTVYDYSHYSKSTSLTTLKTNKQVIWDLNPVSVGAPPGSYAVRSPSTDMYRVFRKDSYMMLRASDTGLTTNLGTLQFNGEGTITFSLFFADIMSPQLDYLYTFLKLGTNLAIQVKYTHATKSRAIQVNIQGEILKATYTLNTVSLWLYVVIGFKTNHLMYITLATDDSDILAKKSFTQSGQFNGMLEIGNQDAPAAGEDSFNQIIELKVMEYYYMPSFVLKHITKQYVTEKEVVGLVMYYKLSDHMNLDWNHNIATNSPSVTFSTRFYQVEGQDTLRPTCEGQSRKSGTHFCQNKRKYLGFKNNLIDHNVQQDGSDTTILFWLLQETQDGLGTPRLTLTMGNQYQAIIDSTFNHKAGMVPSTTNLVDNSNNVQKAGKWIPVAIKMHLLSQSFAMGTKKGGVWYFNERSEQAPSFTATPVISWPPLTSNTLTIASDGTNYMYMKDLYYFQHFMSTNYIKFIMQNIGTRPARNILALTLLFRMDESGGKLLYDDSGNVNIKPYPQQILKLTGDFIWKYWNEITIGVEPLLNQCQGINHQTVINSQYCIDETRLESCSQCTDPNLKLCNGVTANDCFPLPVMHAYDPIKKAFIQCHPKCFNGCTVGLYQLNCINICTVPGQTFNTTLGVCAYSQTISDCRVGTSWNSTLSQCTTISQISSTLSPRAPCPKRTLTASLTLFDIKKGVFHIKFSSPLQDPITPLLSTSISIRIVGPHDPYHFISGPNYSFIGNDSVKALFSMNNIEFVGQEVVTIQIQDVNRFYTFKECLSEKSYKFVRSLNGEIVTADEENAKTISQYLGVTSGAGLFTLFGLSIVLRLCVELIWSYVHSMQIIRIMPIMIEYLPPHVVAMIESFDFVSLDFGIFKKLMKKIPFMDYLQQLDVGFHETYHIHRLDSTKVLQNCSSMLLSAILTFFLFLLTGLLSAISFCCPKVQKWLKNQYSQYIFNNPIRFLLEIYLDLLLFSYINLLSLLMVNAMETISSMVAIYSTILMTAFPFVTIYFFCIKHSEIIINGGHGNLQKVSVLFNEMKSQDLITLQFYPAFLVRRLVYVWIIVMLQGHELTQITLFSMKTAMICGFSYAVAPFRIGKVNFINTVNELFILVLSYNAAVMLGRDRHFKSVAGWVFNGVLLFQLALNVMFVIGYMLSELVKRYRKPNNQIQTATSVFTTSNNIDEWYKAQKSKQNNQTLNQLNSVQYSTDHPTNLTFQIDDFINLNHTNNISNPKISQLLNDHPSQGFVNIPPTVHKPTKQYEINNFINLN